VLDVDETAAGGAPLRFGVDLRRGHKTGFYLDQRDNRRRVAAWCAGRDVLDAFAYSGAFGAHALAAGARSLVVLDSSADALALARANLERNGSAVHAECVEEDVFSALRRFRAEGRRFDAVVLDPPKFAKTAAQVERASRAYKDANLVAMQLLRPGGILATFSCSGAVSADLFQKIVFGASVDALRDVHVLERLGQPADHPVLLSFPEGEYLKGLLCRVL
jgi:23S rRNA (cytosine1962-C5)-methyltransferase